MALTGPGAKDKDSGSRQASALISGTKKRCEAKNPEANRIQPTEFAIDNLFTYLVFNGL